MGRPKGSKNKAKDAPSGDREAWDAAAEKANAKERQPRLPLDAETEQISVELELPTELGATELMLAGRRQAEAQQEIERREATIATAKAAYQKVKDEEEAEIKKAEEVRSRASREVCTGSRWEVVPCLEVHHYKTATVDVYRKTDDGGKGAFVRTRPMTAAELDAATFDPPAGEVIDVPPAAASDAVH